MQLKDETAGRAFVSHRLSSTSDRHKNPVCCIAFGPRAAGCTPISYTIVDASTATTSDR